MRLLRPSLFLAFSIVAGACSSGSGGAPAPSSTTPPTNSTATIAGSWRITAVRAATPCDPNPDPNDRLELDITITTSGQMATISGGPYGVTVPLVNGRIEGYSPFNLTTYDWGLTGNDTFSGTQSTGGTCGVIYQVDGVRTGSMPPANAIQDWDGTWEIVATQTSTTCVPDPGLGTLTETVTIEVDTTGTAPVAWIEAGPLRFSVPIVNGGIRGYSPFNLSDYDWQLTGSGMFTGTQTSSQPGFGGQAACEIVFACVGSRIGPR